VETRVGDGDGVSEAVGVMVNMSCGGRISVSVRAGSAVVGSNVGLEVVINKIPSTRVEVLETGTDVGGLAKE
jgi:hypothetical protein